MSEFASMVFSRNAELENEQRVLLNMPRFSSLCELGKAFACALSRGDRLSFTEFCMSDISESRPSADLRIYPLIGFYPYRFAFAEKCRVDGETKTVVFISERISNFHTIMSPVSSDLSDITGKLIYELLCLDGRKMDSPVMTPEAFSVLSHMPSFTSMLLSHEKASIYCDIEKLLDSVCRSFEEKHAYSDVKFEREDRVEFITEVPVAPLVYTLVSVFAMLYSLSDDHTLNVKAYRFSYASEIEVSVKTSLADRLPAECNSLADLMRNFPSFATLAQCTTVISHISSLILSVRTDKDSGVLTVTLDAGFDYQSEPEFKYSDPYSNIENLVEEALSFIML